MKKRSAFSLIEGLLVVVVALLIVLLVVWMVGRRQQKQTASTPATPATTAISSQADVQAGLNQLNNQDAAQLNQLDQSTSLYTSQR